MITTKKQLTPDESALSITSVQELIASNQILFSQHPFLRRLDTSKGTLKDMQIIAQNLIFYVPCFQDILRMVHERTTDPMLKEISRVQAMEDKGHDLWFWQDLEQLKVNYDLHWVFSPKHQIPRDIAHELVSEVFRVSSDKNGLVIGLSLEGVGAEFFGRVISFLERGDLDKGLKYFARHHKDIEDKHNLFEDSTQTEMLRLRFSKEEMQEAYETVNRIFAAMTQLASSIEEILTKADK